MSSDVVRGSVTQNLGTFSHAEFELRNRHHKWLRDKQNNNQLIFRPMDLVTIWAQRIAGRPIQLFTGYLDEVPYYQAYPGNAIFSATCTLKKLAYTWFDPGLQTFRNWIRAQPGWIIDDETGEAEAPIALLPTQVKDLDQAVKSNISDPARASWASFADLLGRFMVEIAGWDPSDVIITDLPPDMPQRAAELYADIKDKTRQNVEELTSFMRLILGPSGWADGGKLVGSVTDAHDRAEVALPPNSSKIITDIKRAATKHNIDTKVFVLAALVLSKLNPTYERRTPGLNEYGLYAMNPTSFTRVVLIDGVPIAKIKDPFVATEVLAKRLNSVENQGIWVERAKQGSPEAIIEWVSKALGRQIVISTEDLDKYDKAAKRALGTSQVTKQQTQPIVQTPDYSLQSPSLQSLLTSDEKKIISKHYNQAPPELGIVIREAKSFNRGLMIAPHKGLSKDQIFIQGRPEILDKYFNILKGNTNYKNVIYLTPKGDYRILRNGNISSIKDRKLDQYGILITPNISELRKQQTQTSTITDAHDRAAGMTADDVLGEGAITFRQLAAFSANAAFATKFAFPTDIIQAMFLTGERALMNDISCLEGVKQLTQASLRTFRSLPDGRFMAFYPDYFGVDRDPYWQIHDIEIIDLGIQLNDESLATHVYVIGDGGERLGIERWYNLVASRGVATIINASMLDNFIEPFSEEKGVNKGLLADPFAFMQHFGYRPYKEEKPLITNAFYEFLMAWQKFMWLWSQQFATRVEFTFQPEVMAGGLIAFPDHHLQMFCESVTHSFDYSGGFGTTATLTAPSIPKGMRDSKINKPGFALGGSINTVGVD
ncbi:MAG: hypothetical protein QXY15_10325 [Candidatus Nitrosotenuis sp.]